MTDDPQGNDLRAQVASAAGAIEKQEQGRAAGPAPAPRRSRTGLAVLAILAFIAAAVTRGGALVRPATDPDAALVATAQALELTRQLVQSHWDSTGHPPASLAEVGMEAMPFAYRATGESFRLAALVPPGDTLGYQSPPRPPAPPAPGTRTARRSR